MSLLRANRIRTFFSFRPSNALAIVRLLPVGKLPTNSRYCWSPRIRLSASALNLTILGSTRRGVQALATHRTPPTPSTINTMPRAFFITSIRYLQFELSEARCSRRSAGTSPDNKFGGQTLGFGALAAQELLHRVH